MRYEIKLFNPQPGEWRSEVWSRPWRFGVAVVTPVYNWNLGTGPSKLFRTRDKAYEQAAKLIDRLQNPPPNPEPVETIPFPRTAPPARKARR